MSLTVALKNRFKFGNGYGVVADVTFDNSYPTGGESITPAQLQLNVLENIYFEGQSGYIPEYDNANQKIKIYTPVNAQSAHTHAVALDTGASAAPSATETKNCIMPLLYAYQAALTASATKYIGLDNTEGASASAVIPWIVPYACELQAMRVGLGTAPGADKTYTLTVCKNGLDTDAEVTITGTTDAGTWAEPTEYVSLTGGDLITFKSVNDDGASANMTVALLVSLPGVVQVPTATHTHGPGTLADAASGTGGAITAAAAAEVGNTGDLSTLVLRVLAIGI